MAVSRNELERKRRKLRDKFANNVSYSCHPRNVSETQTSQVKFPVLRNGTRRRAAKQERALYRPGKGFASGGSGGSGGGAGNHSRRDGRANRSNADSKGGEFCDCSSDDALGNYLLTLRSFECGRNAAVSPGPVDAFDRSHPF